MEKIKLKVEINNWLEKLASNTKEFIWVFDLNFKVLYVNSTVKNFTGYTLEEINNEGIFNLHTEDSNQLIIEKITSSLEDYNIRNITKGVSVEVEYIKKSGKKFIAEVSSKLIFDEHKKPIAFGGVSRDISERKKREKKLQFQSNLYAILDILSQHKPLPIILNEVLEELVNLDEISTEDKGAIFLKNKQGNLEIVAQKNASILEKSCAIVKPGECLCGLVLKTKEKRFCNNVDHTHSLQPEGMTNHGHYVYPIKDENEILGVLNLYTKPNESFDSSTDDYIVAITELLARRVLEEKTKELLAFNSEKLHQQHETLNKTLKELKESIRYAAFLQNSLLPNQETINKHFKESSVLYIPRDNVSGDFYFSHSYENLLYFGVGDCTGHGIPGAFLAAMSIESVKSIISSNLGAKPDFLLTELRRLAKNRFNTNLEEERTDSMDAGICLYDKINEKLYFSGGFMNLLLIRNNNELLEFKGSSCPVGPYPVELPYELYDIGLKKNDVIYLFSDGYVDQFGVDKISKKVKTTKFKRKRLKNLLLSICHLPSSVQVKRLNESIVDWRMGHEQVDDITIFIAKH